MYAQNVFNASHCNLGLSDYILFLQIQSQIYAWFRPF